MEAREWLDDLIPDELDETGRALKDRYDELAAHAERLSRRFRDRYSHMSVTTRDREALESVKRRGEKLKARLKETKIAQEREQE